MKNTSPMTNITLRHSLLLIAVVFLSLFPKTSISANTLHPNQTLADKQTLVSTNQRFELGFFSPGSSRNRYLGIWYKNISPQTVVWVANRNSPVTNSTGVLKLDEKGVLQVLNNSGSVLWFTALPRQGTDMGIAERPIAKLLDSGNLVVTEDGDEDQESYQWQSFNQITDTLLPEMKLGWDFERGVNNNSIVSWKSADDPSPGEYSFTMEPFASPEVYLLKEQIPIYRSGPWNGIQFSGVPEMMSEDGIVYSFVLSENQKYYSFEVNDSIISRLVVNSSGNIQRYLWLNSDKGWISYWDAPKDQCDEYKECGPYGICNSNDSPVCTCVKGFEPRNKREWGFREGSGGCVRKTNYTCGKDDGFLKMKNMKLPDCSKAYYNKSMSLEKCRGMCEKNCSCTAYANSNIGNRGSGCIIWIGELVDLRQYENGGQDLYVRLAKSELGSNHKKIVIIVTVAVISTVLVLGFTAWVIWKKRKHIRNAQERVGRIKSQELPLREMYLTSSRDPTEEHRSDDLELHLIDFDIIAATTNNFSSENKLGQGGFGSVYKGSLPDGQQIAVKRLSMTSGQGVEEFKNEVMLIAKLQHRNLVRLLGCCISGNERMLIYEYMSNKSLDSFLFDKRKSSSLGWETRFNIILGIARGLLYLHQDSRFRIIHRDLKASNILLDDEMTPKISDFGMARIFGGNQTEANTSRVVGTYGYMAPEYAMDGLFSVKSDVFSFGVLVLEILSGKKNRGFYSASNELNLLGHAWRLWEDGRGMDLLDESLVGTYAISEVLKCLHVGLLCVQEHAEDRPNISSVVLMLSSDSVALGQPKPPGFSLTRTPAGPYSSSNDQETATVNNITITVLDPR